MKFKRLHKYFPDGIGKHLNPKDVDPEELREGLSVETEHTIDPQIIQQIALDHLAEDPYYYTKLKKIEKKDKH